MEKEILETVTENSGGTIEKIYDDGLAPSVKSLGKTASLIPRTIGVWLSNWESYVLNGERTMELTAKTIQERVAEIPLEKLTEPEPYVAIPAMEQLSYCYDSKELKDLYANLLVSSMNIDTKSNVHHLLRLS